MCDSLLNYLSFDDYIIYLEAQKILEHYHNLIAIHISPHYSKLGSFCNKLNKMLLNKISNECYCDLQKYYLSQDHSCYDFK